METNDITLRSNGIGANMKRFFNNESDDFFDNAEDLEDEDMDEEEFTAYIDEEDLMRLLEEQVAHIKLNQNLLKMAIAIAKTKLFWNYKSEKKQMNIVNNIYQYLKNIRSPQKLDEEE